ncbi:MULTISPECIES: type II secretion system F family protein [Paenibacillus]|uniref:type II secretion system F family protein n=1 Tax=Paenibacillus TaxID=44249 RepID=UPI001BD0489E|nr:hypothetical protein [Paenibacillus dendritiformis]
MTWFLIIFAILCFVGALATVLPRPIQPKEERNRLLRVMGFTSVQQKAASVGWNLKVRDYFILLGLSVFSGYLIAAFTGNFLFVIVGVSLCFFVPRYVVTMIQYKRRKEILIDLPHNLRLLCSKFRDHKSLQKSLEASLPLMSGVTKPNFLKLYRSLEIGIDSTLALREMQEELRFQKFNDLCDKLVLGNREGYHTRTVESIRETIQDITDDITILQDLDLQNKRKRFNVHVVVVISWCFPFMFAYMESQIGTPTLETPIGKILIVSLFFVSLITYLMRDKYLSLNLNEL